MDSGLFLSISKGKGKWFNFYFYRLDFRQVYVSASWPDSSFVFVGLTIPIGSVRFEFLFTATHDFSEPWFHILFHFVHNRSQAWLPVEQTLQKQVICRISFDPFLFCFAFQFGAQIALPIPEKLDFFALVTFRRIHQTFDTTRLCMCFNHVSSLERWTTSLNLCSVTLTIFCFFYYFFFNQINFSAHVFNKSAGK